MQEVTQMQETPATAAMKAHEHRPQVPTPGRIVLFKVPAPENYYGPKCVFDNGIKEGDVLPAVVVRTWGSTPEAAVNLRVLCDGAHDAWVTSVVPGDWPGSWSWPTRS